MREWLSVKETYKGKSLVSLLIDNIFLVICGTTRTSFNVREGVGEHGPICVMGIDDPLPTITLSVPV
jgi:hypothetical protein